MRPRRTLRITDPAPLMSGLEPRRNRGIRSAWLGRRFLVWLLIQILISNISGQPLDDGKSVCHARENDTGRNAGKKLCVAKDRMADSTNSGRGVPTRLRRNHRKQSCVTTAANSDCE